MSIVTVTEPRQAIKDYLAEIEDPRGWKYPIPPQRFETEDHVLLLEVIQAMDFYYGGHELVPCVDPKGKVYWTLSSRGYYHYIGS